MGEILEALARKGANKLLSIMCVTLTCSSEIQFSLSFITHSLARTLPAMSVKYSASRFFCSSSPPLLLPPLGAPRALDFLHRNSAAIGSGDDENAIVVPCSPLRRWMCDTQSERIAARKSKEEKWKWILSLSALGLACARCLRQWSQINVRPLGELWAPSNASHAIIGVDV